MTSPTSSPSHASNPVRAEPVEGQAQELLFDRLRANGGGVDCCEKHRPNLLTRLLILLARAWQLGPSVVLPPTCRYAPSCSSYAIEALRRYGALKGGWLAARRIGRCHPWGGSGYDPVP